MRKNPRGLVIELILPARMPGDKPKAMRQIVIFDGVLLDRFSTDSARSKHWRGVEFGEGSIEALSLNTKDNPEAWLGKYIDDHDKEGYEVYGKPFLIEANDKELEEIKTKAMPRAMVLRIDKARAELGFVKNPWTGE